MRLLFSGVLHRNRTYEFFCLDQNTRVPGMYSRGGRPAGAGRGSPDVGLLCMESERDTHKRLSRWLMQNGEIFISLAACLGGAGQPTLYIS